MMSSDRSRGWTAQGWGPRLAMIAAGAIAVLGFAPFHFWGVTLLSLTILFVRLIGVSRWARPGRAGFWTGLLFGLGWFSASCFWIASAFIERGPEFLPMIPPLVGGLAVVLALFWAVAGSVAARMMGGAPIWRAGLIFVAAFMIAELARGHILSGFPWNMAAYAFEPGGATSQVASLIGVYGLTMIIYIAAALIGIAVLLRDWRPALGVVLILAGMIGFGSWRLSTATIETQPGVTLRLVDVPFRQSEKMNPDTSVQIVNRYIAASLEPGIETVTHLVWPEGAVNGLAIENEPLLSAMGALLTQRTATPPVWLMNSLRIEVSPDGEGRPKRRYYNSSVAITFDEFGNPAVAATNDKAKLVPFGEFIPGGEWVERIGARLVSTALGSISPASDKRIANFPGLPPISPQICYEVIFPGLTPRGGQNGQAAPQAILNQSNDAWFGGTIGPAQHAAIARYRAIEEGLPLIRSASNGISGVFDPFGRADRVLDGSLDGHIDAVLPLPLGPKLPMTWVNAALSLLNLCLLLLGMIGLRRR